MIRIRALLLAFAPLLLRGQLDPRLQACTTDVLNIYGANRVAAKPEVVLLVDDSTSMGEVAWDSRFYTNSSVDLHRNISTAFGNRIHPQVHSSSFYNSAVPSDDDILFTLYLGDLRQGILIKPNGAPVRKGDVNGSTDRLKWVARASHVRFAVTSRAFADAPTYTCDGVTYRIPPENCGFLVADFTSTGAGEGTYSQAPGEIQGFEKTRVIDLPLPWTVFERNPNYEDRVLSPAPKYLDIARADKHPRHMYLFDPTKDDKGQDAGVGRYLEVDTNWAVPVSEGGLEGVLLTSDTTRQFPTLDYGQDYLNWVFFGKDIRNLREKGSFQGGSVDQYKGVNQGGYVVADSRDGAVGFRSHTRDEVAWTGNGLPAMTRTQAVKYAILKTFIEQQANAWFAIRFLTRNVAGELPAAEFQENGRSSAAGCFHSSDSVGPSSGISYRKFLRIISPNATGYDASTDPIPLIQRLDNPTHTPLTFALMNTYAQLAGPNSVFDAAHTESPISSCRKTFVVVLSDGAPSDDNSDPNGAAGNAIGRNADPFIPAKGYSPSPYPTFDKFAPTRGYFNIASLSALAAHLTPAATDKTTWPTDKAAAGVKPPFLITNRPSGTTRRINTMTIGVSMPGQRWDTNSPKANMYRAALHGLNERQAIPATLPLPFDKNVLGQNDPKVNPFFFDAQSPEDIAVALSMAIGQARAVTNTMSAPVAPLVGLGVGSQMYVGTFTTNPNSATWPGDLLMAGMRAVGNSVTLLHKNGSPLVDGVNKDTAVWSAEVMLKEKGWKNRNLYTLKPNALVSGTFTKSLLAWNESTRTSDLPNAAIGAANDQERKRVLRFMMGASKAAQDSTDAITTIADNRDDLMGDIINSTPAIVEFPVASAPGNLSTAMANTYPDDTISRTRFRVILVGTNQGILHAFGELSGTNQDGLICGVIDELWGFIPPDLLAGLQDWSTSGQHRYLVDGSPTVYINEQGIPNGMVDGSDFVRVLVGLRKGGRSYYCLSFTGNDPTRPEVAWMIRPDESSDATLHTLGFSTSTPAVARIQSNRALKDVFLLGGGLSTNEVDEAFQKDVAHGYSNQTRLGRSVVALDVYDGSLIKAWDFLNDGTLKTAFPAMGSVAAGVVPVEVLAGSYKTQRVYFSDTSGGVQVLGAMPSSGLRVDSAALEDWKVRSLFHSKYAGTPISTSPAVFPLPKGFPAVRSAEPKAIVPTLGVAVGQGDRNDPMDQDAINPDGGGTGATNRHRLLVVFDRQDSADISTAAGSKADVKGFSEDDLADLTSVGVADTSKVTPSNDSYYLKSTFGYYLKFASGTAKPNDPGKYYYEKAVTSPLVLQGVLFFSKFAPTVSADACQGAGGASTTYRLNDVVNPVFGDGSADASSGLGNGWVAQFNDIPSEMASVGLGAVVQVGEVQNLGTGTGTVQPKAFASGVVNSLLRPRSWRLVR